MSTKTLKNLAVKVRSYTDQNGQKKGQYVNVGKIMQNADGGKFMFIERHVNFAGFPHKEGSSSVLVSMFDPKNDSQQHQPQQQGASKFQEDDIPF